jgi:hypothetical protein
MALYIHTKPTKKLTSVALWLRGAVVIASASGVDDPGSNLVGEVGKLWQCQLMSMNWPHKCF